MELIKEEREAIAGHFLSQSSNLGLSDTQAGAVKLGGVVATVWSPNHERGGAGSRT